MKNKTENMKEVSKVGKFTPIGFDIKVKMVLLINCTCKNKSSLKG